MLRWTDPWLGQKEFERWVWILLRSERRIGRPSGLDQFEYITWFNSVIRVSRKTSRLSSQLVFVISSALSASPVPSQSSNLLAIRRRNSWDQVISSKFLHRPHGNLFILFESWFAISKATPYCAKLESFICYPTLLLSLLFFEDPNSRTSPRYSKHHVLLHIEVELLILEISQTWCTSDTVIREYSWPPRECCWAPGYVPAATQISKLFATPTSRHFS